MSAATAGRLQVESTASEQTAQLTTCSAKTRSISTSSRQGPRNETVLASKEVAKGIYRCSTSKQGKHGVKYICARNLYAKPELSQTPTSPCNPTKDLRDHRDLSRASTLYLVEKRLVRLPRELGRAGEGFPLRLLLVCFPEKSSSLVKKRRPADEINNKSQCTLMSMFFLAKHFGAGIHFLDVNRAKRARSGKRRNRAQRPHTQHRRCRPGQERGDPERNQRPPRNENPGRRLNAAILCRPI